MREQTKSVAALYGRVTIDEVTDFYATQTGALGMDSNPLPSAYKAVARPNVLQGHKWWGPRIVSYDSPTHGSWPNPKLGASSRNRT